MLFLFLLLMLLLLIVDDMLVEGVLVLRLLLDEFCVFLLLYVWDVWNVFDDVFGIDFLEEVFFLLFVVVEVGFVLNDLLNFCFKIFWFCCLVFFDIWGLLIVVWRLCLWFLGLVIILVFVVCWDLRLLVEGLC